jgi:L(+)-tartrate dehydratase beta subunit
MVSAATGLKTVRLKTPVEVKDLEKLEIGNVVYLDGLVFTGREGVYKRAVQEGHGLPAPRDVIGNVNFHCSPAAARRDDGSYEIGAVTATASFRFAGMLDQWFDMSGCKMIIGKGGMAPDIYREKFVPNGDIYLTTVGYGTGALLGRGIRRVKDVFWMDELGIAQAMWLFEVENFGPFLVESDLAGNSLFERENAKVAAGLDKVFEGLKPAIMSRYGETDDRKEELI